MIKHFIPSLIIVALALLFANLSYAEEEGGAVGPDYVDLEPTFIINYGSPSSRIRYLQVNVALRVRDSNSALEVTAHSDAIRHKIILIISRQSEATIKSSAGRDVMMEQITRELQDLMLKETGKSHIDRVLFTSFIIQN